MNNLKKLLIILLLVPLLSSPVSAQQGCCSWHDGISHCDSSVGRYVCNDGTYSPTCGCAYIPSIPTKVANYYLYNDICYDFDAKKFWINYDYYPKGDQTPKVKLKEAICDPAPICPSPTIVKEEKSLNLTPYFFVSGLSFTFGLWLSAKYRNKNSTTS